MNDGRWGRPAASQFPHQRQALDAANRFLPGASPFGQVTVWTAAPDLVPAAGDGGSR